MTRDPCGMVIAAVACKGESAANRPLLLRPTQRPPVRSAGRLRCGDYRLSAASGGDCTPILVRDLRVMRKAGGRIRRWQATKDAIYRCFYGSDGGRARPLNTTASKSGYSL